MARVPQGRAGAGGGAARRRARWRGRGGGRGGAGGGGAQPAAPAPAPQAAAPADRRSRRGGRGRSGAGHAAPPEKRKDPGSDLIFAISRPGRKSTIPEVTEFAWDKSRRDARLRRLVERRDEGRRVRAPAPPTASVTPLKSGPRQLQERVVRRGRPADRVPERHGRVRASGSRRTGSTTGSPATRPRLKSCRARRAASPRAWSSATTSRRASPRTARGCSSASRRRRRRRASRTRRRPCASISGATRTRRSSRCSRCAPTQERNRNYRAVVHLSDKRLVQLATPDLPTVNPGADADRALGTSDLAYQKEMSWDTTYNDVYLVDLKNGQRKKVLEHYNGANVAVAGRQLPALLR